MSDLQLLQRMELVQSYLAKRARGERHTPDEAQAWHAFYELYDPAIRIALKQCGTTGSNLDDLAQQVWLILTRRLQGFAYDPERGSMSAYIDTIARHEASRHRRRISQDHSAVFTVELVTALLDPHAGPVDECEGKECREQLQTILAKAHESLSKLTGQILAMRLKDENSIREIAEALHVSEGVVKMRLSRAVDELRDLLRGHGLGPPREKL